MPNHVLSIGEIERCNDLTRRWVPVPEWSDSQDPNAGIWVRELTSAEHSDLLARFGEDGNAAESGFRECLIGMCAVDESGNRLVNDLDDAKRIFGSRNISVIGRIAREILELNAMTTKSVGELAGNLSATHGEGSNSE